MKHMSLKSAVAAALVSLMAFTSSAARLTYLDYLDSDSLLSPTITPRTSEIITLDENNIEVGTVSLSVDSYEYPYSYFTYNGTIYVGLRDFSCWVDNSVVTWETKTETAYVRTDSLYVSVPLNRYYIEANGRVLWCEYGVVSVDNTTYVPLRPIASAFGFSVSYSNEDRTTYLTRESGAIVSGEDFYDGWELYWLSQIIHAESKGEPFLGKLAVGNVILNRVDSDEFPDDIHSVIFDSLHGVQFTPTVNGAINEPAGVESVMAAKLCLEDTRLSKEILYFLNEEIATSKWIVENCTHVVSIGDHDFYAP